MVGGGAQGSREDELTQLRKEAASSGRLWREIAVSSRDLMVEIIDDVKKDPEHFRHPALMERFGIVKKNPGGRYELTDLGRDYQTVNVEPYRPNPPTSQNV